MASALRVTLAPTPNYIASTRVRSLSNDYFNVLNLTLHKYLSRLSQCSRFSQIHQSLKQQSWPRLRVASRSPTSR
jgi:hypothetical protein